ARAAEAGFDRFEDDDPGAAFGQMQCRRQAGEAGADDRDIGLHFAGERRRRRRRRRRTLPKPVAARIAPHAPTSSEAAVRSSMAAPTDLNRVISESSLRPTTAPLARSCRSPRMASAVIAPA